MLKDETRSALKQALEGLRAGDAAGWAALAPLSQLAADGTEVSIDFSTETTLGAPVIIARERRSLDMPPGLTPRQRDVALALAHGLSNKAIARDMGISAATAKDHVAAVLAALGLQRRTEVAALLHGLKDR